MQPKPMSEGEKRDQAAMKGWLAFLPEIKQEIQSLLELPQNRRFPPHLHFLEQYVPLLELTEHRTVFARLQDCLSRLEKLPSVQEILEETDQSKVSTVFMEFEKVKLKARLAILTIRTNLELGLENWDLGKHTVRSSAQSQVYEFSVAHMWAVNIFPFSYIPARLVVTFEESRYRVAFGVCLSQESVSTSVLTIDLPSNWVDPVQNALRQLDLFQDARQLSLDGIDYELSTQSWTSQNTIWFGNPSTSPFIEIEKAFYSIAEMVINQKGQDAEKRYLSEWQRYLAE